MVPLQLGKSGTSTGTLLLSLGGWKESPPSPLAMPFLPSDYEVKAKILAQIRGHLKPHSEVRWKF